MKKMATMSIAMLLVTGLSVEAVAAGPNNVGAGKHYVFNLIGEGPMYPGEVPDIDGDGIDDPAMCFDLNLVDLNNRQVIGTATDCLSDVVGVGTGLRLVGTTYFTLPQGELVVRGRTTVQPVLHPTEFANGTVMTHITGAASPDNAILSGTGRFAGAEGTVRLSGMVDMSQFGGAPGDPIGFDCIFVVDQTN